MAMLHLLKIRTSIDRFKNEKCKVTLGLEYRFTGLNDGQICVACTESDQSCLV